MYMQVLCVHFLRIYVIDIYTQYRALYSRKFVILLYIYTSIKVQEGVYRPGEFVPCKTVHNKVNARAGAVGRGEVAGQRDGEHKFRRYKRLQYESFSFVQLASVRPFAC